MHLLFVLQSAIRYMDTIKLPSLMCLCLRSLRTVQLFRIPQGDANAFLLLSAVHGDGQHDTSIIVTLTDLDVIFLLHSLLS